MDQQVELLRTAYNYSNYSPDTHTQVGAIIYDEFRKIDISWAYNRFPKNLLVSKDRLEKPAKYEYILHAEELAVLKAKRDCTGLTMVCPWAACLRCARIIIESGISKIVRHKQLMNMMPEKWKIEIGRSDDLFKEARIEVIEYDGQIGNCTHLFDGQVWHP